MPAVCIYTSPFNPQRYDSFIADEEPGDLLQRVETALREERRFVLLTDAQGHRQSVVATTVVMVRDPLDSDG